MIGFVLMCVMGVWVVIATHLHNHIMRIVHFNKYKKTLSAALFVFLLGLPLIDEIIGGMHFWYLCYTKDLLVYDAEKIRDKSVVYRDIPTKKINSIIPITVITSQWIDHQTKEPLITWRIIRAQGGWLSRLSGFPEGTPPYTFDGSCSPGAYSQIYKKYNVTKLNN